MKRRKQNFTRKNSKSGVDFGALPVDFSLFVFLWYVLEFDPGPGVLS